eukprot:scaffold256035_cov17-Tisochrysis_lutea.AAC.1
MRVWASFKGAGGFGLASREQKGMCWLQGSPNRVNGCKAGVQGLAREDCRVWGKPRAGNWSSIAKSKAMAYKKKAGRAGTFDDAAYFDGQYASEMQAPPRLQQQGVDDGMSGSSSRGPVSTAELDLRNPLRRQHRTGG